MIFCINFAVNRKTKAVNQNKMGRRQGENPPLTILGAKVTAEMKSQLVLDSTKRRMSISELVTEALTFYYNANTSSTTTDSPEETYIPVSWDKGFPVLSNQGKGAKK